MGFFLQAVAAGSIKENGVFLNSSLLALPGRSFQACISFHGQVHDFSALFTHIVVVGGCVIVKNDLFRHRRKACGFPPALQAGLNFDIRFPD